MERVKVGLWLAGLSLLSTPVHAVDQWGVSLVSGYRLDQFSWDIAGNVNGTSPNVLSELTWENMSIAQIAGGLRLQKNGFDFEVEYAYGDVFEGDNQDSDYALNGRQAEFSRSRNRGDGVVDDASVSLGYVFELPSGDAFRNFVVPRAGYSRHNQNWEIYDGLQVIPSTGEFGGLESRYDAQWKGGWLGLSVLHHNEAADFSLKVDMRWHELDYNAEADWNLRSDFEHPRSFAHWGEGEGVTFDIQGRFDLTGQWRVVTGWLYRSWSVGRGIDRVYLSNGGRLETRLNGVGWKSAAISAGVEYGF